MCWSPFGTMFAVGSSDGRISIYGGWPQPLLISRHGVGSHVVSSLCWDPKTKDSFHPLLFSSSSGHIGALPHHWVYPQREKEGGKESIAGTNNTAPANTGKAPAAEPDDPLFDDSLLLEGIPPDSIFNDEEDAQKLANCRPAPSHSPPPLPPPVTTRTTNQISDKHIHDDDSEVAPPTKRRNVVLSDTEEERLDPLSPVISSTIDTGLLLLLFPLSSLLLLLLNTIMRYSNHQPLPVTSPIASWYTNTCTCTLMHVHVH
ncbi:PREDICTED: uncharacterized protein LOC109585160 [Amphimedon queenslandica]|uniref:Uncharacterized protein n=1 Tax=Amphimedon queenslandica TaxID=400682 RepID=A0AAN0JJ47_AMPQE|nr:PREDICTED: uncharacterized protein LOC109585160 [Amphimedon queenslandica]|eukprot:XP_019856703.1 PREDICTED: uncharacterized protein LOC109585160 [Amphimedon queenslandica]